MARPRALIVSALATLAVTAISSCGGEDAKLLPGETGREIIANLDTVKQLADEGDCIGAESATEQVGEQVEALTEIDPALKRTLEDGVAKLDEVIAECEEATTEAIAPADIPPASEDGSADEKREAKEEEKREKDEEKEREREEAERESPPPLPPQAKGEAKGHEEEAGEGEEESVTPPSGGVDSGGVGPGSEVGE